MYDQIEQLGAVTGHVGEAAELVGQMEADIAEILAGLPPLETPLSFYHELDDTYFSVTSDTFLGQVYNLVGLRNIADEAEGAGGGYPQLNAEFIISTNPDLIFLADAQCCGQTADVVSARPGWDAITAVANGDIVELDEDIASRWGPRVVDLVRTVSDAVHQVAVVGGVIASADDSGLRRVRTGSSCSRALLLGAMIGPAGPVWWRVPLALLDHLPWISVDSGVSDAEWNVIWQVRMPRVVLAGVVGGMLALAGASYQGVFRNPLVDPYLLGAAAGAGLGATIVLTVGRDATAGWAFDPAPVMAFLTAIVTVLLTYTIGAAFGGTRTGVTLVLAGVAVVSFVTAVQTFILQRHSEVVREVYSWILGTLSTARWSDVRLAIPYVIVCSIVLLLHSRQLDLLRVGDDEASSLGSPVARVRLVVVLAATFGTAAVVAVSGLIGFVGIVVPHFIRLVAGSGYRRVLPLSLLLGAAFLILADIPSRVLADPAEVPIGVVTAFIGAPFFLVVLRARTR